MTSVDKEKTKTFLEQLINFSEPLEQLRQNIKALPFDSEVELVLLFRKHIKAVLSRFLSGEFSAEHVEEWANLVEGRDDIGFESMACDVISKTIHTLANPELEGPLDPTTAKTLVDTLDSVKGHE